MQDFSPLTPHLSIKIVIVRDNTLTMKKGVSFLVTVALIALVSSLASASDPGPLQDTCVAIDEPSDAGISLVTNDRIAIFSTTLFIDMMNIF